MKENGTHSRESKLPTVLHSRHFAFDIYEEQHNSFFRCFIVCVNRIHKNLYLFIISSLLPRQKVDRLTIP